MQQRNNHITLLSFTEKQIITKLMSTDLYDIYIKLPWFVQVIWNDLETMI